MSKCYIKVPVVMQMEALECGAASLCMILGHYQKWIPLEQVRKDCGVSRDGSSAINVLKAARRYGCQAKGFRFEPNHLREGKVHFPCIIHWNFNHFVVLCGFKGDKAVINDPARGSVLITMAEFEDAFTGIVLQIVPGETFVPEGKPKSMREFVKKRLKGAAIPLLFTGVTGLIVTLFGIISPAFSRIFMDRLLTGESPEWLIPFLAAMAVFSFVQLVISFLQTSYQLKIEGKLAIIANASFFWHVLRLPVDFFAQRMTGDITVRQSANESVASAVISQLAPVLLNFAMLVFYVTVMLRYSTLLTAIGLSSLLINIWMARVISQKRVNLTRVLMRDAGKLAGATVAGIDMIETIKASGAENGYFQRWAGYQASVNNQNVQFAKLNEYLGSVPVLVSGLTNLAVLIVGAQLIMQQQFSVGMLLAFQVFLGSFLTPAESLIGMGQSFQEMRTEMERIEDVMEYPTDVEYANSKEEPDGTYGKLRGKLELRNVTFGYSPLAKPLIENFSMTLEPGQRVAFVGPSGCGKSTLSKLISGLYQPWHGEILFDGRPIKEIPREVFTGSLAVVDQEIVLFEDTIAANIKMWDSSIADFEMILAARDAQLHEDIMGRDGGYQYRMMEGGKDFSGGQRQRMEIARVLAQDPAILILDEATSALDAKTEHEVVSAIRERGVSCIVVAHRLSTIRDCDEIIVMDEGHVVERGTHGDLFAAGGVYTALVTNE